MKRKEIHIVRQMLLGLVALQMLNLSIGSSDNSEDSYDYSYTYNKTYDPTESAVEWLVELNYGQQPEFSYDIHQGDAGKNLIKGFHWKTDIQHYTTAPAFIATISITHAEAPAAPLLSPVRERVSPPPEVSID
jgi:hypothetical protein